MKLGIFTTATHPHKRGDNYNEALECYKDLADEVVTMWGDETWPQEFSWPLIGEHFQKGYEECNADWVIHADLDFFFHPNSFDVIRKACEDNSEAPAMTFYKYQFILPDRYNLKSRLVLAVNKKKFGKRIRFDGGGDLCQPTLDGKYIEPNEVPEARVGFYNYEKLSKTADQIMEDVGRMDRAYQRHFGKLLYSSDGSDEDAFNGWVRMATGRFSKPQKQISLDEHPHYIQGVIATLKPNQWGYDGLGFLERNSYAS